MAILGKLNLMFNAKIVQKRLKNRFRLVFKDEWHHAQDNREKIWLSLHSQALLHWQNLNNCAKKCKGTCNVNYSHKMIVVVRLDTREDCAKWKRILLALKSW